MYVWLRMASQPRVFSCSGTENSQILSNWENMVGDQPVQSHSHAQQPLQPQTCVQEHCPGETGLPSSVFQAVWLDCLSQLPPQIGMVYPIGSLTFPEVVNTIPCEDRGHHLPCIWHHLGFTLVNTVNVFLSGGCGRTSGPWVIFKALPTLLEFSCPLLHS